MIIVHTKTTDGLHLHGLLTTPSDRSKTIVIHIHGMAGDAVMNEFYQSMHDEYARANIAFLATENRGMGMITYFDSDTGSRAIGNALEVFEECVLDIQSWVDYAISLGFEHVWLQSHSLGTSKVAYFLSKGVLNNVEGVIFLSPSDMLGLVHDKEGILDHNEMYPEAKKLMHEGKPDQILSHKLWGVQLLSAKTYLNLFGEDSHAAVFNYADESLGWSIIQAINLPVLAITGEFDDGIVPVMNPTNAMKKLSEELIAAPRVQTIILDKAYHGFDGFGTHIVQAAVAFINQ